MRSATNCCIRAEFTSEFDAIRFQVRGDDKSALQSGELRDELTNQAETDHCYSLA